MKHFLLAILLPACASFQSHAVTGAAGRQTGTATVGCVDLSVTDCLQVQVATTYLDDASGLELLRWVPAGVHADIPVSYGSSFSPAWSKESYAVTQFHVYMEKGVFANREVVTFFPEEAMSAPSRQTMFRHELGHAIGLPHNEWDRTSLMFPRGASDDAEARGLNDADLRMLGAIYERSFGF